MGEAECLAGLDHRAAPAVVDTAVIGTCTGRAYRVRGNRSCTDRIKVNGRRRRADAEPVSSGHPPAINTGNGIDTATDVETRINTGIGSGTGSRDLDLDSVVAAVQPSCEVVGEQPQRELVAHGTAATRCPPRGCLRRR